MAVKEAKYVVQQRTKILRHNYSLHLLPPRRRIFRFRGGPCGTEASEKPIEGTPVHPWFSFSDRAVAADE